MKVRVTTGHVFRFECDAGLLAKQICKLNGNNNSAVKAGNANLVCVYV